MGLKTGRERLFSLHLRGIDFIQEQHSLVVVFGENKHRGIALDCAGRPTCHEAFLLEVADKELDVVLLQHAADKLSID